MVSAAVSPHTVSIIRERRPAVPEDDVVRMWLERARPDIEFESRCRRRIRVIDPGRRNRHDGPDFRDAVITVDGALRRGEIEIHTHPEDWRRHGHGGDPRYATVVLHVCLYDGAVTVPFPTIVLSRNLGQPFREAWLSARSRRHPLACMRPVPSQPVPSQPVPSQRGPAQPRPDGAFGAVAPREQVSQRIEAMLVLAAARRFDRKKQRMAIRLEVLAGEQGNAAAFRQLVYELCARATGYGGNERQFETLARKVPLRELAVLPMSRRAGHLAAAQPAGIWNASGVMPHNRIGRRLAWFAAWAGRLDDPAWWRRLWGLLREGPCDAGAFAPLFHLAGKPDNPGAERIVEFMINVLAPAIHLYAGRHGSERGSDAGLARAALKLYVATAPAPQNRHTRLLSRAFELSCSDGERQQGMIELSTEFCEKERCTQCLQHPA